MQDWKMSMCRLLLIALCVVSVGASQSRQPEAKAGQGRTQSLSEGLSAGDLGKVAAIEGMGQSATVAEWLGPMAPVALSPFFGITCLCALSQYGGDWVPGNTLLSHNAVLNDPTVLWIFAGLTLLTSLPRLTKVSKPLAQAIDQLETYAGIVTIVIIRVYSGAAESDLEVGLAGTAVVQMGLFSFTSDVLLSIAAIINIVVINTVKFFCEVIVWLTPFPFVDAMVEALNKTICGALMAVYAYSPMLALGINLALFAVCLVAFRWIQRRVTWLRMMVGDPIWAWLRPSYGRPVGNPLVVFPQKLFGPFAAKTRLELQVCDGGWQLLQRRWILSDVVMDLQRSENDVRMLAGIITNRLVVSGEAEGSLLFTQRYAANLELLAQQLEVSFESIPTKPELAATIA